MRAGGTRGGAGGSVYTVNYVQRGHAQGDKVLLVHGFGGSAYHWRHNIIALADAGLKVYAIDLLGFGRSDKYSPALWREQLAAFIEQVVQAPAVLVGNSLGGYASLVAAAERPDLAALQSELMRGGEGTLLALAKLMATGAPLPAWARSAAERVLISGAFYYLRTPSRIREVLESLYPTSRANID